MKCNGEKRNFSFMFTIPTDIGETSISLLRTQLFEKENPYLFVEVLKNYNETITTSFTDVLKRANVIRVYRKTL